VPTDDEAWEQKPAHARLSKGKMLYEARGNVSASSVLRASLFRELGLRVGTLENGPLRFPADGKLSLDIKAAGFWCAWSERYYVRNVGHEVAEFEANPVYYQENYANKPWLGIEGWETRVALQKAQPRVDRKSIIFGDRMTGPQRGGSVATDKLARLWSSFDAITADVETIEFLHALTRLVKPRRVLETRTWLGLSACAIGRALILNGFGHLTTLEVNSEAHAVALKNIEQYGVQAVVTPLLIADTDLVPDQAYDMAVFDLAGTISLNDVRQIATSLADRAIVVLHANSDQAGATVKLVQSLADTVKIEGLTLSTPRGIFVGCLNRRPVNGNVSQL
jgi:predicted O-methyltransferase YrrM